MSKFDIGQSLAIEGLNILAVEGAEGSDAMMKRAGKLSWKGTLKQVRGAILVKALKKRQSKYADLPTIGPKSVEVAVKNGFSGIALRKVLIIDKPKTIKLANKHNIFIWGG